MDDMYGPPHPGALQVCGREENQKRRFKYVLGTSKRGRAMKQRRTQKWVMCLSTMLILVLCLALSLSGVLVRAPAVQAAETYIWTQLPLYGGNVSVLAINPKTPTTVYASTGSQVFRSVDGGGTWIALNTSFAGAPPAVMALAIDPVTPSTLYAGTYGSGIFRSANSGDTWTAVNTWLTMGSEGRGPNENILCLAINPVTPSTLYAGTLNGVFRSTDSGNIWTTIIDRGEVRALVIDPYAPSTLYAGTSGSGVFRSTDSGNHWTAVNTGIATADPAHPWVTCLAIDPLTPSTLYAGPNGSGLFRSMDSGDHWTAANTGLGTYEQVWSLAINLLTPTTLYAGNCYGGVYRSTDSGTNWVAVNPNPSAAPYGQIECPLAIDPLTPSTLYAGTEYGVSRSTDNGTTWSTVNAGITGQLVTSLAIDPNIAATLYVGTRNNGIFRSTDSGNTWTPVNTGFTNTIGSVTSLAVDPLTPSTLYAGTDNNTSSLFRSTDSGNHWTALNISFINTLEYVTQLVIDPLTPSTLYAATNGVGIFRSTDSGDTWTAVSTGSTIPGSITSLAINPKIPATLYAGTGSGSICRSVDAGTTWTLVKSILKEYPNDVTDVNALAVDPVTPSTLYAATYGNGVSRSMDGGDTWTAADTGLRTTGPAMSLAIDPLAPATLYAGVEDGGLLRSTDRGNHWTAVVTGVFTRYILPLAFDTNVPAALYASTYGAGIFRYGVTPSHALTTTVSPSAGGSIVRVPNATSYAIGTVVTLTASPAIGYAFTGWSGALTGMKNPVTVTMNADKKITASFAKKTKRVLQLRVGSRAMYVDGQFSTVEATPIILNSRTLLPIRAVVEATGGTIAWNASAQRTTIVRKGTTVELWIGKNVATLNGQAVNIDSDPKVVPIIMSGRTLLPLRFVAEALALGIQWNATTEAITITYTP